MMNQEQVRSILRESELFGVLSDRDLNRIVPLCSLETYREGELIFKQGSRLDHLYILVQGSLAIVRSSKEPGPGEAGGAIVEVLAPGRLCGWSSLVQPHVATASARALVESQALTVDGSVLNSVLDKNHPLGYALLRQLVVLLGRRVTQAYKSLEPPL